MSADMLPNPITKIDEPIVAEAFRSAEKANWFWFLWTLLTWLYGTRHGLPRSGHSFRSRSFPIWCSWNSRQNRKKTGTVQRSIRIIGKLLKPFWRNIGFVRTNYMYWTAWVIGAYCAIQELVSMTYLLQAGILKCWIRRGSLDKTANIPGTGFNSHTVRFLK